MSDTSVKSSWLQESGDIFFMISIVGIILLMVIPIPPFLLDGFLVISITISLLILMVSFYSTKPLDFSVFPVMLLFSTLLRLTLNIATTRLILLNGSKGEDAAGSVIKAFGYFVAGGNYVIGLVVFIILVIINFVVITKGSGRIAEVAARFTLDSMPGKQLAIDADLNAGIINEKDAKARRERLEREADFYGAMDGASKFVRGDAIAGILITIVNIVGGFIIGMVQEGHSFDEALKIYTVLSIGDGLVAQIPALIVSISAGIIVTKVSKEGKISTEIGNQTFMKWKPVGMAAGILVTLSFMPGIPFIPFVGMAGLMGVISYFGKQKEIKDLLFAQKNLFSGEPKDSQANSASEKQEGIPSLDPLEVEVGYDLISLVDQKSHGEFPTRIVGIRKQFAQEMGVWLPPVHIRDNLKLKPNEYRLYLKGAVVGKGELLPKHHLALDPGIVSKKIDGIPTKDPTFGLDALWIPDTQKDAAMVAGYTVVDLPSIMATHLIEVVRANLHELFGRQDLSTILEQVKQTHPKVVSDLIPELLSLGTVLKVCQNLLRERVSIRDMLTILESLAEQATHTKDPDELTERVRMSLGRSISQQHASGDSQLYVITLARTLEEKILRSITPRSGGNQISLDPNVAKNIVEQIGQETKKHLNGNHSPVVLTSQQVRPHLSKIIEKFLPNLAILAHSEVAGHVSVKPVAMIGEAVS